MSYDGIRRVCDRPRCTASYDALTGPNGQSAERHWLSHPTFGLHMCPDHSNLWRRDQTEPHLPTLDPATRTASCSCATSLAGPTRGDLNRSYRAHLADVLDAAHPPGPGAATTEAFDHG